MFWRQVELYSYVVWLLGQRQLLLSLLGMSLILICSRFWRRQSSASVLAAWLFFLSWLVWAPLVFTPERLQDFQSPLRHYWTMVAPADVFTLCSQSILHRLRTPPLAAIPQLNWNLLIISGWGLQSVKTDRKSTRLNSSHVAISYAVFCLKKKKKIKNSWRGGDAPQSSKLKRRRVTQKK